MLGGGRSAPPGRRKIMVVADPTQESAGALHYALSQAVVDNDELILLHVENPNSWRNTISMFLKKPGLMNPGPASTSTSRVAGGAGAGATTSLEGSFGRGDVEFLEEMKSACKRCKPKLNVRIEKKTMVEGKDKDKATVILDQTKVLGIDILIIGQRKSLSAILLGYRLPGASSRGTKPIDTAEYLIDNSNCTCVGVQKKGQNGGYLLNTKTHKNFWLLA
ncbi:uncharacterized protein LOC126792032 [Argentina anserina]|uniref:uncharacterized protein LOC126792032 n=1 Tax=Argentina anserina TaxID=57926 RepID=UPI0021763E86|nr:uncharacterized protein LOC126792032 [Potentilla anserina]